MARPSALSPTFQRRARKIQLLVLDVDGVLTDGRLLYGPDGEETKAFHVRDGLALVLAQRAGLRLAVVSSRASAAATRRMNDLGVTEVWLGVEDKRAAVDDLLRRWKLEPGQVAYMGDDLPDLQVFQKVGLALAPADAVLEVRRVAHWVARRPGGGGAVREAVEALLRARKAWPPGGAGAS